MGLVDRAKESRRARRRRRPARAPGRRATGRRARGLRRRWNALAQELGHVVVRQHDGEPGLEPEVERLVAEIRAVTAEIAGLQTLLGRGRGCADRGACRPRRRLQRDRAGQSRRAERAAGLHGHPHRARHQPPPHRAVPGDDMGAGAQGPAAGDRRDRRAVGRLHAHRDPGGPQQSEADVQTAHHPALHADRGGRARSATRASGR